jgi:hypothetical protein
MPLTLVEGMPKVRFGTFAGKNLVNTSTIGGLAQLAPKNHVGESALAGGRQYGTISKEIPKYTPEVAPGQSSKGTSDKSLIVTTTEPIGNPRPNTGDTPLSHVTPDAVFITPEQYSRENTQWEGNVTWNTVASTIKPNLIQKIRPQFGLSPAGSLNGNGNGWFMMMLNSDLLLRYRQDSGFPQNAASNTAGFAGGVSVYSKPLDTSGTFTSINPATPSQSQATNPRQMSVSTDPTLTTYPTFDATTFVVFLAIVAAIWFMGR